MIVEVYSSEKEGSFTGWITKDGVNKKVKKDELNNHLYDGWVAGRK